MVSPSTDAFPGDEQVGAGAKQRGDGGEHDVDREHQRESTGEFLVAQGGGDALIDGQQQGGTDRDRGDKQGSEEQRRREQIEEHGHRACGAGDPHEQADGESGSLEGVGKDESAEQQLDVRVDQAGRKDGSTMSGRQTYHGTAWFLYGGA